MEQWVTDLLETTHLEQATKRWGGEAQNLALIGEAENFVYKFPCQDQSLILRLTHSTHRTEDILNGELDWIDYLHRNGAQVCRPILSINNKLVERIPTTNGYFSTVVFEESPGTVLSHSMPPNEYYPVIEELGRTMGQMHRLAKIYKMPPSATRRPLWYEDDLLVNAASYVAEDQYDVLSLLDEQLRYLHTLPQTEADFGLIHADVHFGNFFVHDDGITLFDFDDCGYNWFIFDIMIPIYYRMAGLPTSEMCHREEAASKLFVHLMRGYHQENHLEVIWFEQLTTLLRFRDLQLYIWIKKNDWASANSQFYQFLCDNIGQRRACVELDFTGLYDSVINA